MRSLVWFRSDLRVRDNTALTRACKHATTSPDGGVVGVFVVCPEQWREHDWGDPKVDFVMRSVASLKTGLAARNVPLKIVEVPRFADVPNALLSLARRTGCTSLCFNTEFELNEQSRDANVTEAFEEAGLEVDASLDKVIFEPGSVLTKTGGWYTVYSPFKKNWRAKYQDGGAPTSTGLPKKQPEINVESDEIPASVRGFQIGARDDERGVRPDLWDAGEDEARRRLKAFAASRIGAYKDRRNLPSVNGTSTLSPYLAVGSISPRQCVDAALEVNDGRTDSGSSGVVGWIEELIWREFYQHLLVAFPKLCKRKAFRPEMDSVEWNRDEAVFDRWCRGETGYPIVDAGMRQLNATGWMHNRVRMIVAMFLTKDLMIDWRWGERYFMNRLVDGDFGANNGGWQWSASTGTDAQPYFRIFNPTTQGERFDKDGSYIKRFVPELAELTGKAVHDPSGAGLFATLGYPEPIIDHKVARDRALAAFKTAASSS
ncbi:MAG: deoxyribodipyrimidine photo-lyase [Planctomycetota bacterium]